MRVLYVSHTSKVSGAERSLLALLGGLPANVQATVACPAGPLADAVSALKLPVVQLPGFAGSLRWHPRDTPIAVARLMGGIVACRRAAHHTRADLIHANSIRAGLMATNAARFGGPSTVVHVHDCLPRTRLANLVRRHVIHQAAMILVNSNYTASNFLNGRHANLRVVYNPIDQDRFDPDAITRSEARDQLGLDGRAFVLGVVAQITPWKGQADAIQSFASVQAWWPTARLLIVGEAKFGGGARHDTAAYGRSLHRAVHELGVAGHVDFLGERQDLAVVLRALDLLLVPSWEEPFGMAAIEAMAMEVPVVATNRGGPAEIITDGEDGLLLPPRQPARWAHAVEGLLRDPVTRAAMGRRGRETATTRFSRSRYVDGVVRAYYETLESINRGSRQSGRRVVHA